MIVEFLCHPGSLVTSLVGQDNASKIKEKYTYQCDIGRVESRFDFRRSFVSGLHSPPKREKSGLGGRGVQAPFLEQRLVIKPKWNPVIEPLITPWTIKAGCSY